MASLAQYITPTLLIPLAVLAAIFCFVAYYWQVISPRRGTLEWIAQREAAGSARLSFFSKRHPMERRDAVPLLLVTVVYAFTAFFQLGSFTAPQSALNLGEGQSVELELQQEVYVSKLWYYSGLGTGDYNLEISSDGSHWSTLWSRKDEDGKVTGHYWADAEGYSPNYALPQHYADLFKWLEITPENPQYVRYLRITGRADRSKLLELGELVLFDQNGAAVPASLYVDGESRALVDEQDTVPESPSWYNSTYFDEIYHARTAYEHLRGVYPYEISHPPLGKLLISIGIQLFGMTPFGWRSVGTLFGVLMLPLLYVFLKNLFGKTPIALCGTALFAFDFMHLVQTRIATIDTYAVFFILGMYFFLYRYLTLPAGTSFKKGALPLFLSGLFWGIGAASKWTVIYGGIGLAALYFIGLWFKWRDWPVSSGEGESPPPKFAPWLVKTLLFSVLCFVLIPAIIYCASYLPYAAAKGDTSLSGLWDVVWSNQKYMLTYHNGVHDYHPYSSRWYQWIVDGRPILYYQDFPAPGYKAAFAAFNNPVVCWAGLLAMVSVGVQLFRRRCGKALFILVGYFSQLAPWFAIGRTTFEYHYFPSLIFLVLAICYLMDGMMERGGARWKLPVYGLTGGAVAVYAAFYPVLIGLTVPTWYNSAFLKWLPSWPI